MAEEQKQEFRDKNGAELSRGDLCKAYTARGDLIDMCAKELLRIERLLVIDGKPQALMHNDQGISIWWVATLTERIHRDPKALLYDMSDQEVADHTRSLMKDLGVGIQVIRDRGYRVFLGPDMEIEGVPPIFFRKMKVEEL